MTDKTIPNFTTITVETGALCTTCRGVPGRACDICFGLGYVCPECYNHGKSARTGQLCACGVHKQRAYYYEERTMRMQNLWRPNEDHSTVRSPDLERLERDNYEMRPNGHVYNRFYLIHSDPVDFMLYRNARRAKAIKDADAADLILRRGMVYISVPELERGDYFAEINKAITNSPAGVLVFMGVSAQLPHAQFPYLSLITHHMDHPMFIFCDEKWGEQYYFLGGLVIDVKQGRVISLFR